MSPLLDTNILVDLLNGHPAARDYLKGMSQLTIASVTAYEVLAGCVRDRSGQLNTAELLINHCEVLPVTAAIAARAAGYQRRWNRKRKMADFLIEATAEEHGLDLATRNPKDFRQVTTLIPYTF